MTLFDLPESLSPRLAWMRKYEIDSLPPSASFHEWTVDSGAYDEDADYPDLYPWTGFGATEDEALADFARKNQIRLWNEEGAC